MIFLHMNIMAKVSLKSVTIGEEWIGFATYNLEVKYHCASERLLVIDSRSKNSSPIYLKDSIDAVSFINDIKALKYDSCLIEDSQGKDEVQIALDTISKKKRITTGGYYLEFSNGEYIYLGRKSCNSVWFMYWNGKLFSVDEDRVDSFRQKYTAINWNKVAEDIRSRYNEDQ